MDRRVWGTGVVALAIVAALVVPNLGGLRVVGSGSRIPVPAPPAVGQCLLASVDGHRSALAYSQVVVAAAPTGPCGDANYGEVVAVTPDRHTFPTTVVNSMGNPDPLACQPPARGYLGWDVRADPAAGDSPSSDPDPGAGVTGDLGVPGRTPGFWRPVAADSVGLLGPDLSQYLSGQTWIACVVYPRVAPYSGSVRGGSAGAAAGAFAACSSGPKDVGLLAISCLQPHDTEMFGAARPTGTEQPALIAACRDLVGRASGMTDPTAGGELTIDVLTGGTFGASGQFAATDTGSDQPTDSAQAPRGRLACVVSVTGTRLLVGSLTGIGDGPLPWA